jgi:hypothetical protein
VAETRAEVVASLRREHPDLTDAQIERLLTGPPTRPRPRPPLVDNRGKYESRYSSVSTGRTTSRRGAGADPDPS